MNKIRVEVKSVNIYGKYDTYITMCDTLIDATRILLKFKPKRNYKVVKYTIEHIKLLV